MTTQPYNRPTLTKEEQKATLAVATKINGLFDKSKRFDYIVALIVENTSLLKEANDHRAARGIAPLKVHDIDAGRVG